MLTIIEAQEPFTATYSKCPSLFLQLNKYTHERKRCNDYSNTSGVQEEFISAECTIIVSILF